MPGELVSPHQMRMVCDGSLRMRGQQCGGARRLVFLAWLFATLVASVLFLSLPAQAEEQPVLVPQVGHISPVTSVAFSPDGKTIASGSEDNTIILWDAATGEVRRQLKGHTNMVTSVAFSPDGKTIASGSYDDTIILWDAATGEMKRQLKGHSSGVTSIAFSPDGKTIASGNGDGTIILWDAATGEIRRQLKGHTWDVSSVAFSPDGETIASGSCDGTIILWDAATGEMKRQLKGHTNWVQRVAFSPDGSTIASGSDDETIILWDAATGEMRRQLKGHSSPVWSVAFSPDGKTIASGSEDHTIILWDAATGEMRRQLKGHLFWQVFSVAFSPDGKTIASGSSDHTIILWDAATGEMKRKLSEGTWSVHSVAFSPDGKTIASGRYDGAITLWDAATGEMRRQLKGHSSVVWSVAFSPDGKTIASGSEDHTIILWDAATGEMRQQLKGHSSVVASVAFSPDGKTIASGSWDDTIILWDAATGEVKRQLEGHTHWVQSVAFSPDGKTIASGSKDGTARVWDPATGEEVAALFSIDAGEDWLIATPQGYYNASLNGDRYVRWWIGNQLYPVEQFSERFKRPELVARALRREPLQPDIQVISTRRTPPLVALEVKGGRREVEGDTVPVRIAVTPGAPEAVIKRIELRVNGRLIDVMRARDLTIASKSPALAARAIEVAGREETVQRLEGGEEDNRLYMDATITLLPGEEQASLVASAFDDQDLRGDSDIVIVRRRVSPKPAMSDLYVLAVGISRYATTEYNLRFADRDALDLAAAFRGQEGRAFRSVNVKTVTNEQATRDGVREGLSWLQTAPKENDIAIVFFSGHGVQGQLGKLYFFTHEGDLDELRNTCLPWTEVDQALRGCRARQVIMFMDCCHAGAFGERRATAGMMADPLVKKSGVLVFASSRGDELSLESDEWGHGAFAKAVLDGLRGAADPYRRGAVTVTALVDYVSATVAQMTGDRQHPWLPRAEQFDTQLKLARLP